MHVQFACKVPEHVLQRLSEALFSIQTCMQFHPCISYMHANNWQDESTAGVLQQLASLTKKAP